ncbi:MAG: arginyltransferase [Alphaproteobacteria bacterium]|nr:arginyltransferase [Alphaproteobacteria bacterium]
MPDIRERARECDLPAISEPPRFLFRTPPMPCPYLAGRIERHVFAEIAGAGAVEGYDVLARAGFRRSHRVAYRPSCSGCSACVPVRVVADLFQPSRSQRRVARANVDLVSVVQPPGATAEQFRLFARYQRSRHGDGEMARMGFDDYRAMIEDTSIGTSVVEFRLADGFGSDGRLMGACLFDRLGDGLSAVYSFFDPVEAGRGLGTFAVLWLVEQARRERRRNVYLGYWIADSRKMAYKARFQPLEQLAGGRWQAFTPTGPLRR